MQYVCPQAMQLEFCLVCLQRRKLMEPTKDIKPGGLQNMFSRRNLLKGAVGLAAAASVPEAFAQDPTGAPFPTVWLYIGTYTGNPGGGGNGEGIYLCSLNLFTGKLTVVKLVAPV